MAGKLRSRKSHVVRLLDDVAGAVPGVTDPENRVKSATPVRVMGKYVERSTGRTGS